MASSTEKAFEYHCIVLHTADEFQKAEKLCDDIIEYGEKTGRRLNVTTFDSFSNPGKQDLENLHEAVEQSRFILCTEEYAADSHMSHFFANAALHAKIKGRFIMLKIDESTAETKHPTLETLSGIRLTSDWDFHANDLEKLVKNLSGKKPERPTPQARNLPDPNTGAGESELPTRVIPDAEPFSMSGTGSQVAPLPLGDCSGAKGKGAIKKTGSSKTCGTSRPQKCTVPGDKDKEYKLDAIVFHSTNETRFAESFLQTLRSLGIQAETFESMAHPAKQDLTNVNDALRYARYVMCSMRFYAENEHGRFFANTALHNKSQESEFILLYTGSTSDAPAHMNSLRGVRLSEDWQFPSKQQQETLVKMLTEKCTQGRINIQGEMVPAGSPKDKHQENRSENSGGAGLQGSQETPQPRKGASSQDQQDQASSTPAHLNMDKVSVTSSFFDSGMRSRHVPGDDAHKCPEPSSLELFESGPSSPHTSESGNPSLMKIGAAAAATAEESLVQSSGHQNTERKRVGDMNNLTDSQQADSRTLTALDNSNNLPANGLEEDNKSIISTTTSGDSNSTTSSYHDHTSSQTACQREPQSAQVSLSNASQQTAAAIDSSATAAARDSSAGKLSACSGDDQSTRYAKPAQNQSSIPSSEANVDSNQEQMEALQIRDSDDISSQSSGYFSNPSTGHSYGAN